MMIATPLHSIVQGGQLEDIELILQSGATKEEFYGESAFHYAAKRGDVRIIKLLLNHGFDIDIKDRYYTGNSPFHLSCRHSCVAAVEFFLSENVDVCVQNNFGETPFHLACEAGNFEIVNLLIDHHRIYGIGADISVRSTAGLTPLMYACMDPQMQNGLLKLILDNLTVLSSAISVNRVELLQYAVKNSQCKVIRFLVSYFKMDARQSSLDDGNSSLHWASCGRVGALSTLLSLEANVNATNFKGATPLILAASCGQVEAVHILLQHGADPSMATSDLQQTAWHVAAQRGFVEVLKELIAHHHNNHHHHHNNHEGGNSSSSSSGGFLALDSLGNTPLHWACRKTEALSSLLECGLLDVNAANNDGETPLLLVAQVGTSEEARLLLQHGADVGRLAPNGDTALHAAIHRNNVYIFQELVSHPNCPLDTANSAGLTPLLVAVSRCAGAVPYLLQCGADVTRTDPSNGETALHLAVKNGDPVVIEQLLSHYPYVDFLLAKDFQGIDPYQLAVNKHAISKADLTDNSRDIYWVKKEEAFRRQALDLMSMLMKNGELNWNRRRHYAVFLSGISKTEKILWSKPTSVAVEEVLLGQDTRGQIAKFL